MSELEWMDIFSGNLQSLMYEKNISQRELARRSELTQAQISKFINKQSMPSIKSIINLSIALDVNFDELAYMDEMIY